MTNHRETFLKVLGNVHHYYGTHYLSDEMSRAAVAHAVFFTYMELVKLTPKEQNELDDLVFQYRQGRITFPPRPISKGQRSPNHERLAHRDLMLELIERGLA